MRGRKRPQVAARIKGEMYRGAITSADMAKLFRMSPRSWSNWMRDPEGNLTLGRLEVIAAKLGVTVEWLVREEER